MRHMLLVTAKRPLGLQYLDVGRQRWPEQRWRMLETHTLTDAEIECVRLWYAYNPSRHTLLAHIQHFVAATSSNMGAGQLGFMPCWRKR